MTNHCYSSRSSSTVGSLQAPTADKHGKKILCRLEKKWLGISILLSGTPRDVLNTQHLLSVQRIIILLRFCHLKGLEFWKWVCVGYLSTVSVLPTANDTSRALSLEKQA